MKKIVIALLLTCVCSITFAQTFKADTSLVFTATPEKQDSFFSKHFPPFLAVYQKEGKTLVVLGAIHHLQSVPVVHYAFEQYNPQIALIEREPGQSFGGKCTEAEDAYTAALSAKNNIPLVRADLNLEQQWKYAKKNGFSYEDFQMLWMLRNAYAFAEETGKQTSATQEINDYKRNTHNPAWGELFTESRLLAYFQQYYGQDFNTTDFVQLYTKLALELPPSKWVKRTPFYRLLRQGVTNRSVFMLENITAALNNYQVVFAEMGATHFIEISKSLKKMLGNPRYIQADQTPTQEIWTECSLDGLQEKVLIKD